jgi:nucleoside phosphorylase
MLNAPPPVLLTHIAHLQAAQMTRSEDAISTIVTDILKQNPDIKEAFTPPAQHTDYLFRSLYHHINQENDYKKCDQQQLRYQEPRDNTAPHIHYGLIASRDQVIKDSKKQDSLAQQLGILCFKMEAAGLINQLPTLIIQDIYNYCNSHKQKQ